MVNNREQIEELAWKVEDEKGMTVEKLDKYLMDTKYKELLLQGIPNKKDRARAVYHNLKDNPTLSQGKLCALYDISTGYFRDLRLRHQAEWDDYIAEIKEENVQYLIKCANNKEISDKEFNDLFGNVERSKFIIS